MKQKYLLPIILLAIPVLWVGITLFLIPIISIWIPGEMDSGQVGDSFGAVNALFSGLALGGIILTLIMQRQELELQREELKLTREELAKAAIAQEKSSAVQQVTAELTARQALLEYYRFCFTKADSFYQSGGAWLFIDKMEEESHAISDILSKFSVVDGKG